MVKLKTAEDAPCKCAPSSHSGKSKHQVVKGHSQLTLHCRHCILGTDIRKIMLPGKYTFEEPCSSNYGTYDTTAAALPWGQKSVKHTLIFYLESRCAGLGERGSAQVSKVHFQTFRFRPIQGRNRYIWRFCFQTLEESHCGNL